MRGYVSRKRDRWYAVTLRMQLPFHLLGRCCPSSLTP
jgi:hypothetical protein